MADDAQRHARRATFNEAADGYDAARPIASPEVFDDLVERAGLAPGARVLEIGCGTGQATLPLAERGFSMLAVELGANLAEVARRKLAAFRTSRSSRRRSRNGTREARSSTRSSPSTRSTGSTLTSSLRRPRPCCGPVARSLCSARASSSTTRRIRRGSSCSRTKPSRLGSSDGTSTTCATGRTRSRRAGTSAPSPERRTSGISRTAPTTTSRWSERCRRTSHSRTMCARNCSSA